MLDRGFALVTDAQGKLVRRAADVARGEAIGIEFSDGRVDAVAAGTPPPRAKKQGPERGGQGSLF